MQTQLFQMHVKNSLGILKHWRCESLTLIQLLFVLYCEKYVNKNFMDCPSAREGVQRREQNVGVGGPFMHTATAKSAT